LYDQAGLMVRVDEANWVKGGMDVGGVRQVSAVVTREYSDWSVAPLPGNPAAIWLRLWSRDVAKCVTDSSAPLQINPDRHRCNVSYAFETIPLNNERYAQIAMFTEK
jgi:regulation of enolase protein 1 (concanavalin A-like superfamily)